MIIADFSPAGNCFCGKLMKKQGRKMVILGGNVNSADKNAALRDIPSGRLSMSKKYF